MADLPTYEGGCACGAVRYKVIDRPVRTHACHCRWCQRETGSAFAINSMYETDNVKTTSETKPEVVEVPTATGQIQWITRCPRCKIAIWSQYALHAGKAVRIIRAGTFDNPDLFPPEHHIYTSTMQPWLILDESTPQAEEFYDRARFWSQRSLDRLEKALQRAEEPQGGQ
ncbi:uncharacterized protein HMPREF1541_02272 [Cyphellophora europaea CBS 101466]|uniref:CENP-V/GFA domain-containing protein n=1 Tax=Cyphellophora europaea (strain CBS 101466) TaxID=1220924 RepID=W2S586_CYPE1|nr:uncharacterized protein HMPREF1541_02272 [Cyphellophora europaea CBS 101466]ETN43114.1 hypothetical protein HMPREF1541_02272 [Cyphellophora europaea CBS 101466]